jgi:hypothetical protein
LIQAPALVLVLLAGFNSPRRWDRKGGVHEAWAVNVMRQKYGTAIGGIFYQQADYAHIVAYLQVPD